MCERNSVKIEGLKTVGTEASGEDSQAENLRENNGVFFHKNDPVLIFIILNVKFL